ncbi:hypothetical protein EVAR_53384_1 [Eumeta japonica]|uniref:Uncharacterized protein n=1 Tax=Eumeta variegata TaxID=151549 RepID=A0A4C1Y871_EUMVA|nr:hypothetical protein EVAR_53384_1 [Eumeta japonica]
MDSCRKVNEVDKVGKHKRQRRRAAGAGAGGGRAARAGEQMPGLTDSLVAHSTHFDISRRIVDDQQAVATATTRRAVTFRSGNALDLSTEIAFKIVSPPDTRHNSTLRRTVAPNGRLNMNSYLI